jgi:hypothetical protein
MKIGICKLGTLVSQMDTKNDMNGRYREIYMLKQAFDNYSGVRSVEVIDIGTLNKDDLYDKIFMLNNVIDCYSYREIKTYKAHTKEMNYILTDLRLVNNIIAPLFNTVFTQTTVIIDTIKADQCYSGMPELAVFGERDKINKKDIDFIFGGGTRNREDDFQEYILNALDDDKLNTLAHMKFTIGDESDYIDTRVPINKYLKNVSRSKYSIVINDPEYNKYGFISWRYYENISRAVITFIDSEVDKCEIIHMPPYIRKFLSVSSYQEMKDKIIELEGCEMFRKLIHEAQYDQITYAMKTGVYTVNKLLKIN